MEKKGAASRELILVPKFSSQNAAAGREPHSSITGAAETDDPHDKEKGGRVQPVSGSNARLSLVVRLADVKLLFLRGQILARARDELSEIVTRPRDGNPWRGHRAFI